jgi:TrmH family RNA methyltransferase
MVVRKVESTRNPFVKKALSIREKRSKYRHGAFIIEGPNLVAAALEAGDRSRVERVFVTRRFMDRSPDLMRRIAESRAEVVEVTEGVLRKLSAAESPQGIAAVASYTPAALESISLKGVTVVSDGIQDPGNLGAIIRTADFFGCDAVVLLEGTCDAFSPKTLRATAGSIFHVPVVYAERERLPAFLREKSARLAVTAPGEGISLPEADLTPPLAFVFGNEAGGISRELRGSADFSVRIPVLGQADSLNVAVAKR